ATVDVYQRGENGEVWTSPATTVALRRGPSAWTVTGATTDSIVVDTPATGATVTSPMPVSGRAHAFEGTVVVRVVQVADETATELGFGVVTGGGTEMQPFSGTVTVDLPSRPAATDRGWVSFTEHSAANDSVWRLTVVPVRFG
nr:Gmad2 immunoglobulin-like domain-containing protein [Micromonospora sp. DSM 115978]